MNKIYTNAPKETIDELISQAEAQAALDTLSPMQEYLASRMNDENDK